MTHSLNISCQRDYPLFCGHEALEELPAYLREYTRSKGLTHKPKLALICDTNTSRVLYKLVSPLLDYHAYSYEVLCIEPGEASKSLECYYSICSQLRAHTFQRDDLIVAVGGGVVGDLAGFVASSYMRGIAWINIPTSLLAMVDASIGGKVALNLDGSKNMLGAFWNPSCVIVDTRCLASLPHEEFYPACAEIIKHGFLGDASLLSLLSTQPLSPALLDTHPEYLATIILKSLMVKSLYIEQDPREEYRRALLNFGHSLGHALESKTCGHMPHGSCIAIGMLMIVRSLAALSSYEDHPLRKTLKIASNPQFGSNAYYQEMLHTLETLLLLHKLPTSCPISVDELFEELVFDKKTQGENLRVILLGNNKRAFIERINIQDFYALIKLGQAYNG